MKEIKSKTSSAKKTLVPWFETMGKQVGLSQETISAVLKEQRLRIRKLNYASAYTVSNILIQDCGGADDMWSNYAKLALILERCKYIPCGSRACAYCSTAQLTYCNPNDKRNFCRLFLKNLKITQATDIKRIPRLHPPPDNVIAERHEDAQARSFG
ncbi:hypothetical protein [Escherichia coli]|uniref:hypothetical protein n=1 Tax=Escherichia coli TaxID=562 RepID=UPI000A9D6F61|nr:hypothetical protein [Escherichia coli]